MLSTGPCVTTLFTCPCSQPSFHCADGKSAQSPVCQHEIKCVRVCVHVCVCGGGVVYEQGWNQY